MGIKPDKRTAKSPTKTHESKVGISQKHPPLTLAPHLGRVASSPFSLHSHLALLELSTHTKAAPSASPLWEAARVLTNLGTMVAPSWHFRASWQGHGSMLPLQRNPHRAFVLVAIPPPRSCVACRHPILLRSGCSFALANRASIDKTEVRAAHFYRAPASPVLAHQTAPCGSV